MNQLIEAIASDLNINKYNNELDIQYYNRLLYCAIHTWIYANTTPEIRVKDEERQIDVDIMSIIHSVVRVLDDFLVLFPQCRNYFLLSKNDKQISSAAVISRLISKLYLYNAIGKTTKRRYANIPQVYCDFSHLYLERGGNSFQVCKNENLFYTGIGRWHFKQTDSIEKRCKTLKFGFHNVPIIEWIQQLHNNSLWRTQSISPKTLIYISCCSSHSFRNWEVYKDSLVPKSNYTIIRDEYYRYYLCRYNAGEIEISDLNEWYVSNYEINRILFGLDLINNKPSQFPFCDLGDRIHLKLYSSLPVYEQAILAYSGWPNESIDDMFNYIIDIRTWPIVKSHMERIGIVLIKEKSNG